MAMVILMKRSGRRNQAETDNKRKPEEERRMQSRRHGSVTSSGHGCGGILSTVVSLLIIATLSAVQMEKAAERKEAAEQTARTMAQQQIRMYVDLDKARRAFEHKPPMDGSELAGETRKATARDGSGICVGGGWKISTYDRHGMPTKSTNDGVESVATGIVQDQANCADGQ